MNNVVVMCVVSKISATQIFANVCGQHEVDQEVSKHTILQHVGTAAS